MMLRLQEAESTQTIGDLRQKIAELEVQVRKIRKLDVGRVSQVSILLLFNIESRIDYS